MIFLSNRKLKLMIITLLLLIFCFFLGIYKSKAETLTENYGIYENGLISSDTTYAVFDTFSPNPNKKFFANKEGELTFSFYYANESVGGELPWSVSVSDGNNHFQCSTGSYIYYNDNNTQRATITAVCNVAFNSNGWKRIEVSMRGSGNKYFLFSLFATYSSNAGGSSGNISSQLQSIYTRLDQIGHDLYTMQDSQFTAMNTHLIDIYNILSTNNTTIQNIQTNTQNINDSINDSTIDSSNASSSANTWNSKNATNGTITQLLTLPITLLQAIVNGISTSCSSFSLGSLFGTNITLPCINLSNLIGSGLYSTIDILFSGFMILAIGKKFIKIFNDFTNLKSNQIDELYGGGK